MKYQNAWADISRAMDAGTSWSGHERNNAFWNLGAMGFLDISGASGLDFDGDGRAVCAVDWDGDGDQDLWLRSRTAPGLRFLENNAQSRALRLSLLRPSPVQPGALCEALGARVAFHTSSHVWMQEVRAGSGYLAQSDAWLVQALAPSDSLASLEVWWPGGKHQRASLEPAESALDSDWVWVEGQPAPIPQARRVARNELEKGSLVAPPDEPLVVLRSPLPLLPEWLQTRGLLGQPSVLVWNPDGATNDAGLATWIAALQGEHIPIVKLGAQAPTNTAPASGFDAKLAQVERSLWPKLMHHVVELGITEPSISLGLLDAQGQLQAVALAPLGDRIPLAMALDYLRQPPKGAFRGSHAGRWFHGADRDFAGLAESLGDPDLVRWKLWFQDLVKD